MRHHLLALLAATALATAVPAVAAAQSINERQASLDQRIDAGIRAGSLTSSEASQLRAEFNDLVRLEGRYRAGGLTGAERADLDRRFDMLSQRIRVERNDRDDRYDRDGGNINQRQRQLDARIDAGVQSGSLTTAEAARLRAEFAELARLEARYRANGLSDAERSDLDRRFDGLQQRIRVERNDRDDRYDRDDRDGGNINQRQRQLDARIDAGVQSGSLTTAEAARLRAEYAELARLEARYRANGLSDAERSDLDRRFDGLQQRIRVERNDRDERGDRDGRYNNQGGGGINAQQRDLEARIEAGVRDRTLTRNEANQLRTELDTIARIEAQYRASGGLSQVERQYLDRRIDLLERRLRTDRRDDDRRWSQLDARQASFDQQLDQAVRERRLSEREAYNLRMEFRAIAQLERQYRNSRPGITQAERIELNRRFDRMEANLRATSSPTDNLLEMLFGLIQQR